MKNVFQSALLVAVMVGFMGLAHAEESAETESHEQAEATAEAPAAAEHMSMEDMHGMMNDCMKSHKNGKMCQHQAMEKCEANMSKADCKKMMKEVKGKKK